VDEGLIESLMAFLHARRSDEKGHPLVNSRVSPSRKTGWRGFMGGSGWLIKLREWTDFWED